MKIKQNIITKLNLLLVFLIMLQFNGFAQHERPRWVTENSKEVLPVTIFRYKDGFEYFGYWDEYLGLTENDSSLNILRYNVLGLDSLWCAGMPNKSEWDSTYLPLSSKPNALLTDSVNTYPPNNHSVIEIVVEKPAWTEMFNYCWSTLDIKFGLICDTDTLNDGIYIDISFDGGNSFVNALDFNALLEVDNGPDIIEHYSNLDISMIQDSILGFSGRMINEGGISLLEGFDLKLKWDDQSGFDVSEAIIQIHFISDSIDNNKQGILIDELSVTVKEWCHYVGVNDLEFAENNELIAFPNPVLNESLIRFPNGTEQIATLSVFNSLGQLELNCRTENDYFIVKNEDFDIGIYHYTLVVDDRRYCGKFVVN
ncbi:MAG: T9SS type A sorting domain-containing protein [Bacteroidales bacterium]|jgi:hypothetical protein|nr:T9SS type A sorting domain-containing protein [Bacteroidales bacterium]